MLSDRPPERDTLRLQSMEGQLRSSREFWNMIRVVGVGFWGSEPGVVFSMNSNNGLWFVPMDPVGELRRVTVTEHEATSFCARPALAGDLRLGFRNPNEMYPSVLRVVTVQDARLCELSERPYVVAPTVSEGGLHIVVSSVETRVEPGGRVCTERVSQYEEQRCAASVSSAAQ